MARKKGSLYLASNIEPSMAAPLDSRTVVDTLSDLTAENSFPYIYVGMRVFVKENLKSYEFIGTNPEVVSHWRETSANGKSAYDIAVENGFVGTEKEWLLSLKGKDGEVDLTPINEKLAENNNSLLTQVDSKITDGIKSLSDDVDNKLISYKNDVQQLDTILSTYNHNLINFNSLPSSLINNGITFSLNEDEYTVTGTASAYPYYTLMPDLIAGINAKLGDIVIFTGGRCSEHPSNVFTRLSKKDWSTYAQLGNEIRGNSVLIVTEDLVGDNRTILNYNIVVSKDFVADNCKLAPKCYILRSFYDTLEGKIPSVTYDEILSKLNSLEKLNFLEDARTDRKMIWHDEFDSQKFEEWKFVNEPLTDGISRINCSEKYMRWDNSLITMNTIKELDDNKNPQYVRPRISTKRAFRNCLIEIKAKGIPSFWLSSIQDNSKTRAKDITYPNHGGEYGMEIDVGEYYGNSDKLAHFNVHIIKQDNSYKTYSLHSGKGYNDTGFEISKDEWHIYGIDMINCETFDFYLDRQKLGRIIIDGSLSASGHSPLEDMGLSIILDSNDNVGGASLTSVQYDWIRVYENIEPEHYTIYATDAKFMNINGTIFENDSHCPSHVDECYTLLDDSCITTLFLKPYPTNCCICPRIESISVENAPNNMGSTISSLQYIEFNKEWKITYPILKVVTDIGIFEAEMQGFPYCDDSVPPLPDFTNSEKIEVIVDSAKSEQMFKELATLFADKTTHINTIKMYDIMTDEPYILFIANGSIRGLSQGACQEYLKFFQPTEK